MAPIKDELSMRGLLLDLYQRGLGELVVLHRTDKQVLLGNMVMEKGDLVLKDSGAMK